MNEKTKLETYNILIKDIQGILIKLKSLHGIEDTINNIQNQRQNLDTQFKEYLSVSNKGKGLAKQKALAKKMYDWSVTYRSNPEKAMKLDLPAKFKNKNVSINTKLLDYLVMYGESAYNFLEFLQKDLSLIQARVQSVKDKLSKFDSAIQHFVITDDDLPRYDELAVDDEEITDITDIEPTKTVTNVRKSLHELSDYILKIKKQRKNLINVILFLENIDIVDVVKQQKVRYDHIRRLFSKLKLANKTIYDGGLDKVKKDYYKLLKASLTVLPNNIADSFKTKLNLNDKSELDLLVEQSPKFVKEPIIPAHAKITPIFSPIKTEKTEPTRPILEKKIEPAPLDKAVPEKAIGDKITPAQKLMLEALWDD